MEVFISHLWKSAVLITLFYIFYTVFLQKETYFRSVRYFLIAGILLSILIPFITITKHVDIVPFQGLVINNPNMDNFTKGAPFDWTTMSIYVYSIITLVLLIKFLFQLFSISQLICKNNYSKVGAYYFIETSSKIAPFSFFNYIVYNPKQFEHEELKQVLAHEKAHASGMHSLDTILSNLVAILLWFNPFVWLYKRKITQNLEFIADECAQNTIESQHSYQQLLLKMTIPNYQMALANNFYNSLLKKRIIMLHKQRSNNKSQWKFALLMPILLAFIFVFNTKIIAQEKDKAKKIVKINVDVFSMGITKESSKKDLENISNTFLDKGLKVKFSNIKRNNDNEIIAININAKAKNGKAAAAHASELENGINPIQISFDNENNNLSIGSNSDHNLTGYTYSKKSKGNSFVFISDQEDDKNTWVTTKGSKKIIIETDFDENDDDNNTNEVIKITTKNDESNKKIIISSNNDKEPLIILDGKEITKKEMDNLDTDAIKSINVYKGAKAIKKYGEKAVNGVIVINKK